jgi:hypothetical protein
MREVSAFPLKVPSAVRKIFVPTVKWDVEAGAPDCWPVLIGYIEKLMRLPPG